MHNMLRRVATVAGATVTTIALTAGTGFAHECYIANRSEQGGHNAGTKSQVWFELDLVASLVEDGLLTSDQAECVQTAADEAGLQTVVTIMGKVPAPMDGVLGSKNPNVEEKMGDGKGIDEFFSGGAVVPLIGIVLGCGGQLPPEE
jgi:hypothetical protein